MTRSVSLVEIVPELAAARRVPELAQGFALDLADAFAGHSEFTSHLLEGAAAPVVQAEAQFDDLALAPREGGEDVLELLAQ